ncbi:hypothetical protein ATE92_1536 [Ulvibacter sp. MAR_2010_11]|uniref:hypothetical protein n=1 Tax=Ulvibacter sp. MAR_2010_11 TaxID=1250229 RepID=UPI000C2BAD97|nr:hypothetical protein [Ulvibacter sp. MAR_2010_11]PKA83384.1 hypothetical protein ATE92_1536 [Ulvibacter sp. MAR_2010_11]
MKKITHTNLTYIVVLMLFSIQIHYAQVGIGTVTPRGALDLGSTTQGIIYPRVALTANNVQAPVTNPNGGNIVAGTMVYNTSLTTNAANNVYPGIYAWNGSIWSPQFIMEEYKKYEQTSVCQRTTIRQSNSNPNPNDDEDIAGLTNQTFTPKYAGTYKVEVRTNFGAGQLIDFTSLDAISLATSEGSFFFTMSGTGVDINPASSSYDYMEGWLYTHSYSTHNSNDSPALQDNTYLHNASLVYYLYLVGGTAYNFNLSICITTGHSYFLNNGDTGEGRGHVGHDRPCSVEFTYLRDN